MMEAQEVETLRPFAKIGDPGLVGMQAQPEGFQGRLGQVPGRFGPFPGRAEDDEVVAVTDQRPQSLSTAGPRLVEDVEGDVGEQGGNRRALRGSGLSVGDHPALEHPGSQPSPQQLQHLPVNDPAFDLRHRARRGRSRRSTP